VRWEAGWRNEVWQADHKQLEVLVAFPGRRRALRPWVTSVIDDRSRRVMGWAISVVPSAAEVLAALRDAMLLDDQGRGGIPERLRVDRGLEFCATAIQTACLALGVCFDQTTAYAPQQKGKVERLHGTITETLLCGLPGFTGGPRDVRGRLEDAGTPLAFEELVSRFATWVAAYNRRSHSALDRLCPDAAFDADPTPLRELSARSARALLAARRHGRVRRDGVHHHRLAYTHPALADLVGEDVEIAFAPHDDRSVEVYWRGEWRCTAHPQHALTPAEQHAVLAARQAHAAELRRRQRAVTRTARSRIAPATAASPKPVEVRRLPVSDAVGAPKDVGSVREHARTDLLLGSIQADHDARESE